MERNVSDVTVDGERLKSAYAKTAPKLCLAFEFYARGVIAVLLGSSEDCVRRIYSAVTAAPSVSCVSVSLAGNLSRKLRYAGLYSEQTTQQTDKDQCASVHCDLAYKDGCALTWQQITLYPTDKNGCVPGNRLLCTLQRDKDGWVPGNRLLCTYRQRRVGTWQQITLYLQTDKDGCAPGNRLLCTYRQRRVCTQRQITLYLQTDKNGCVPGNRLLCTYRQTKTDVYLATDCFVPYRETKTGGYLATDYFVPTDRQRRVCTRQQITLYLQRRVCTRQQITLYLQTDKNGCVPGRHPLHLPTCRHTSCCGSASRGSRPVRGTCRSP